VPGRTYRNRIPGYTISATGICPPELSYFQNIGRWNYESRTTFIVGLCFGTVKNA